MTKDSNTYKKLRQCRYKKAYPDAISARKGSFSVYKCEFCGMWHRSKPITEKTIEKILENIGDQ